MKFSINFAAMLSLVGQIKSSLNCFPSLELRDITHTQCTYTDLFTGRISKLGLHSLQSYVCVRITSWITLVSFDIYERQEDMKMNRILVVFPPLPKKIFRQCLNVLPMMCLSKYNHTLHFREGNIFYYFSAVTLVNIRMRVELLYLLI